MNKTFITIMLFLGNLNTFSQDTISFGFVENPQIHDYFLYCHESKVVDFNGKEYFIDSINEERINIEVEYSNGNKIKAIGYFQNSKKYRETHFNGKKRDGLDTRWYKNGNKDFQGLYKDGKQIMSLSWYENGSLKSYSDETNGETRFWYKEGLLKLLTRDTNICESSFYECSYYKNGVVFYEGLFNSRKQKYIENFYSGQRAKEGYMWNDPIKCIGDWKEWYENGIMKRKYFFDENQPNIKTGTWSWWDKKGNLIKQEIYKNNELIEEKNFLPFDVKKD